MTRTSTNTADRKPVNMVFPVSLVSDLRIFAAEQGLSMSALVRLICIDYIERRKTERREAE